MSPAEERSRDVYTVVPYADPRRSWLSEARTRDRRLMTSSALADVITLTEGAGTLAFPAGWLRAASGDGCDQLACTMLELSARSQLALVFGLDVGPPLAEDPFAAALAGPSESYAFVCDGGRPLLWPARQVMGGEHALQAPSESRCVCVGGQRVGIVLASEVFNPAIRQDLARDRPDVILVLTYLGPTRRWKKALDALQAIAPTITIGESPTLELPAWTGAPSGWVRSDLGCGVDLTLSRYRVQPAALQPDAMALPPLAQAAARSG